MWSGRRVLIVGMARSGEAAARLAVALGASVTTTDLRADAPVVPGTRPVHGGHSRADFLSADLIVMSPGVPAHQPDVVAARASGVRVLGELAFAGEVIGARGLPMVAVTGTNGKSSTTWFTGQLLESAGRRPFVGGNYGSPLSLLALDRDDACDIAVVEVSSYQMEWPGAFHPVAAAVLNLTPDHLARHGDMDCYAATKMRLFAAMGADDFAILPAEPPSISASALPAGATPRALALGDALRIDGDTLHLCGTPDDGPISLSGFALPGAHNRLNLAVAIGLCICAGVPRSALDISAVRALPHRLEPVADVGGVRWVNDSKATNVDAARVGIEGVGPTQVVLLGGQGKAGADYESLRPALAANARHVICFGASGPAIASALVNLPVVVAPSLVSALPLARALARTGDTVLLSPACASFDEFRDFEHRGEVFTALARGGTHP